VKDKNTVESLSISQALALARKKFKRNLLFDALDICDDILKTFPDNKGSKDLIKKITTDRSAEILAETCFQDGNSLYQKGEFDAAINYYKKSLRVSPGYFKAYFNMAVVFQNRGHLYEAIENYIQVLSYNPSTPDAYFNVASILRVIRFSKYKQEFDGVILEILNKGTYVRPSEICPAVISLLREKPVIKSILQIANSKKISENLDFVVKLLSQEPLFLKLISLCPIPDLDFENLLKEVRAELLQNIVKVPHTSSLQRVLSSIALQCFTNEYVYKRTRAENKKLAEIETAIVKKVSCRKQLSVKEILIVACYKPLHECTWSGFINQCAEVVEVVDMQIHQVKKDQKSANCIKILKEVSNAVSVDVQKQYEVSPYPRWIDLRVEKTPLTIEEITRRAQLRIPNESIHNCALPQVLIAGCGTGQQSIEAGFKFKNSRIFAVDLSVASLSYASRKTGEFGLNNIEYMQADILDLPALGRKFDIIECCGVLHHMDNPFRGWELLTECLNPGGLMKIALYSEKARGSVNRIRKEIIELGIESDSISIKNFRDMIISSDETHHKAISSFTDFYCLSELRDLLFNVKEHQFIIPDIESILNKLKLSFCGFESDGVVNAFISENPQPDDLYNLSTWNFFESQNLNAFSGMYQFWCQKLDETSNI